MFEDPISIVIVQNKIILKYSTNYSILNFNINLYWKQKKLIDFDILAFNLLRKIDF